jgi:hypothetical protein
MKAFLAGVIAAIVIALAAAGVLRGWLDWSTANVYQSHQDSVRL